jgi:hypothetical protein
LQRICVSDLCNTLLLLLIEHKHCLLLLEEEG